MGGMKLSELDFLRLLPAFMRDDEAVIALSKAVNRLMGEPGKRLSTIRTWDKIGELNEAECDELAWELDIDWYDSESMGLEEKRETIKLAQQIKRKRGTKWAVERLISAYFGEGHVLEWYEMGLDNSSAAAIVGTAIVGAHIAGNTGGTPYTFMVLTTNPNITPENYGKFAAAANAAKNERSHIVGVYYFWQHGPDPGVEYALDSDHYRYDFEKCGTKHRAAIVGVLVKSGVENEPEEKLHLYGFKAAGENTCGTYPQSTTVGAALKAKVAAAPATAHALYSFPKCGANCDSAILGAAIADSAIADKAVIRS